MTSAKFHDFFTTSLVRSLPIQPNPLTSNTEMREGLQQARNYQISKVSSKQCLAQNFEPFPLSFGYFLCADVICV